MSMKSPGTVKYHKPEAPFYLDPVEINKGDYDLRVLTWKKISPEEVRTPSQ